MHRLWRCYGGGAQESNRKARDRGTTNDGAGLHRRIPRSFRFEPCCRRGASARVGASRAELGTRTHRAIAAVGSRRAVTRPEPRHVPGAPNLPLAPSEICKHSCRGRDMPPVVRRRSRACSTMRSRARRRRPRRRTTSRSRSLIARRTGPPTPGLMLPVASVHVPERAQPSSGHSRSRTPPRQGHERPSPPGRRTARRRVRRRGRLPRMEVWRRSRARKADANRASPSVRPRGAEKARHR